MKKINKLNNSINVDLGDKASPETSINTTLDMNQQLITNVADASDPSDGLNILQTKEIIGTFIQIKTSFKDDLSNFILLSGTTAANPITGDLLFNNNATVTGLKAATDPQDAVNFLQSKQFFSNKYIALSGNTTSNPITGDLYLNNTLVTSIRNAVKDSEAVPLQQLQEIEQSLLPLSGGTLTGPINMDSHKITNVPEASSPTDLISLGQAKEKITTLFEECVPLTGNLPDTPITGNIVLNNTLISQLPLATEPSQIISLANLNAVSETLVPLNNPTLSGNIDLSGHLITNVAPATTDSEGVNLQQFTAETHSLFPLSGGTMSVDLDMGNNTVSSLDNTSLQDNDLINLSTLTNYVSTSNPNYIPLSGTVNNNPVTGNLIFDSKHLITGISDPTTNEDAVNLEILQSTMQLKMLLSGGTLTGPLNMNNHSLTNLSVSDTPQNSDAANLGYLKNLFASQKYIPRSGTTPDAPITGSLFFNNSATCTQIKNPEENSDAVNLQTLQTTASEYLSLSGGTLTGTLDMNNHQILNIPDPMDNTDPVNLSYLKTAASRLVPLSSSTPITMKGSINMNSHTFTNVPAAALPSELVNFIQVKTTLSDLLKEFIPFSGTPAGSSITGDLELNNTSVKNLAAPTQPTDAVTLLSLQTKFQDYLLLTGGTLTGNLNADNQIISGVQTATKRNYAATLDNLNTLLDTLFPLSGGTLSGNLNMNGNKITTLAEPTQNTDAVNLSYLTKITTSSLSRFIPFSGTLQDSPITGDLVLNNTSITNISSPTNDADAIQLQTLTTKTALYLPLSGGTLSGTLNMNNHTLTNLKTPFADSELINLAYLNSIDTELDGKYIPLIGTVTGSPITGDLVLQNTTITNISSPNNDTDAIQLQTLNDKLDLYLPLSGGTLTGPLNMNNHTLTNLKTPSADSELINLAYLNSIGTELDGKYIPLTGTVTGSPITGDLVLSNTSITNISSPTNDTDAIQLQTLNDQTTLYLPLSGGTLSGLLNMNNHTITNLKDPSTNSDIVPLNFLNNKSALYLPLSGGTLSGPLNMNGHTITNLNTNAQVSPTSPYPLISLEEINSHLSSMNTLFVPLSGTIASSPITGNIVLNNNSISNISSPNENSEAIQLQTLNDKAALYLPLSGGTLSGPLNMNGHTITNLNTNAQISPTGLYPLISLEEINSHLSSMNTLFVPLSGTIASSPITGNIVLNNNSISNISSPNENSEAIQLQTLNDKSALYFPLSGGTLSGSLNMNSFEITGIREGTDLTNAITYSQMLNNTSVNNYVLLSTDNNITGTLALNNTLIKNIPTTTDNTAAINLDALNTLTQKYLPLTGGTLSGPVNMNTSIITNLGDGTDPTDAANYGQLMAKVDQAFYIKTNAGENQNLTWEANANLNFTWSGTTKNNATPYDFSSQNYSTYFNITDSRIYILKQGVFLFNIIVQTSDTATDIITMGTFLTNPSIGTSIEMNQCSQTIPLTLYLSTLLPLSNETITSTNTYLEVTNLSSSFAIKTLSWDITLLHYVTTTIS